MRTLEQSIKKFGSQSPKFSETRQLTIYHPVYKTIKHVYPYEILYHNFCSNQVVKIWWNYKHIEELRCFITNNVIYLVNKKYQDYFNENETPWGCSQEHLIANFYNKTIPLWNTVPCSTIANKIIGHVPLLIKLYIRDELKKYTWNRDDYFTDKRKIARYIIDIKTRFQYNNKTLAFYKHILHDQTHLQPLWDAIEQFEQKVINMKQVDIMKFLLQPLDIDVLSIYKQCLITT